MKRHLITLAAAAALATGFIAQTAVSQQTSAAKPAIEPALAKAVANADRAEANRKRDAHRHPAETLAFFGLKPGMTVVEIIPGGGYYTEILSPYLAATNGKYIGTGRAVAATADAKWGPQSFVEFSKTSGPLAPAGTVDMVVTFRNIHNLYWQDGMVDKLMADTAAALKPGGVFGVEEHRADPRPETVANGRKASDGYVSTATVIEAAKKAGLVLEEKSEINANAKDTKDHPFGVWTLPPNSRTSQNGVTTPADFNPAKYTAIGESDRMTLRFRKPK